jgi:exosortase/archaeosortase family protein
VQSYPSVRKVPGSPGRHAAGRSQEPAGSHRRGRGEKRAVSAGRLAGRAGRPVPFGRRTTNRALRILAISTLGAIALMLIVFQFQFRVLEADVAAHLYRLFTPVLSASKAPIIWFGLGAPGAYGLEITPDCSSALLIVPLCGLGMLLMIPRKLPIGRVAKALTIASAVLVGGNLLRIGVIAICVRIAGVGFGYQVGHLVFGSAVSIVCIAISLVLLIAMVTSRQSMELAIALLPRHRRAR